MIALVDLYPVLIHENRMETTISTAVKISALLLFDPSVVVVGAFLGTAMAELRLKRPYFKKIFNVSEMTLTYTVLIAIYAVVRDAGQGIVDTPRNIAALGLLAVSDLVFNNLTVSLVVALATRSPLHHLWLESWKPIVWHDLSIVPLGAFIAILWQTSPWAVLFAALPLFLVRHSYHLVGELRRQTLNALMVLARMLDERDDETHRHCELVATHAAEIARILDLPQIEIDIIHRAAFLHDIGKIGMSNAILFKPSALTPEERERAKKHAIYGSELLKQFPMFSRGALYVRHHHERWDGKGYPDGIAGEAIPLGARILSVADSFQAMVEDRPYRKGFDTISALKELAVNAGTQFDPTVVKALFRAKGYEISDEIRAIGAKLSTPKTA